MVRDPTKTKVTKEKVKEALTKSKGRIYLAARALQVSHTAVYSYLKRWPDVGEIVDAQKGELLDFAEGKLYAAIKRGEAWAICFFLKTQGKSRGYIEKQEVENTGAVEMEVVHRIITKRADLTIDFGEDGKPRAITHESSQPAVETPLHND